MSFMSTIPNDLIAHTAAQAAVMESMYAEIDFWRKFADSNPTGGSRKRRAEAEEMLAMNEKLKEFQAEVSTLKSQLQDEKDRSKEFLGELNSSKRAARKLEKELDETETKSKGVVESKIHQLDAAKKKYEQGDRDNARLAEKYRSKRRALTHVLEARQELVKLCSEDPAIKKKLQPVVSRWKNEYQGFTIEPSREPSRANVREPSLAGLREPSLATGRSGTIVSSTFPRASSQIPRPSPILPPPSALATGRKDVSVSQLPPPDVPRKLVFD